MWVTGCVCPRFIVLIAISFEKVKADSGFETSGQFIDDASLSGLPHVHEITDTSHPNPPSPSATTSWRGTESSGYQTTVAERALVNVWHSTTFVPVTSMEDTKTMISDMRIGWTTEDLKRQEDVEGGNVKVTTMPRFEDTSGLTEEATNIYETVTKVWTPTTSAVANSSRTTEIVAVSDLTCGSMQCKSDQICKQTTAGIVCVSRCELRSGYCLNNGICSVDSQGNWGCWCPSTSRWWYRGNNCEIADSTLRVGVIAGVCCLIVATTFVLLILQLARLYVRAKQLDRRLKNYGDSVSRLRFPKSSTVDRERQFSTLPTNLTTVSRTFDAASDNLFERTRRPTSTFVQYAELGTITREGEARTKFTTRDFSEIESVNESSATTNRQATRSRMVGLQVDETASSSNCGNFQLKRSPCYGTTGIIM